MPCGFAKVVKAPEVVRRRFVSGMRNFRGDVAVLHGCRTINAMSIDPRALLRAARRAREIGVLVEEFVTDVEL